MSKTLDALKKLSQLRDNNMGGISLPDHGGAIPHSIVSDHGIRSEKYQSHEERNLVLDEATHNNGFHRKQGAVFQNIMLMVVAVITAASLFLCLKTLSEVKHINHSSVLVASDLALQKDRINALEKTVAKVQFKQESQVEDLKTHLNTLTTTLKKEDTKIAELTTINSDLSSAVKYLKWSMQNLTDKYVSVNAQLNNLKEKK